MSSKMDGMILDGRAGYIIRVVQVLFYILIFSPWQA